MQEDNVRMTLTEVEKLRTANAMLMGENRLLRARVNGLLAMTDKLKKQVAELTRHRKYG